MESTKKNTKRGENWTAEDKILLQELVRERVGVIENKNTDTNSNSRKVAAWVDLHKSFDVMRNGTQRTVAQLKSQWGSIKIAEKRKCSAAKKNRMATGGGPPPREDPTDSNDIRVWLPQEFETDTNDFDSDSVYQVSIITANKEVAQELEAPAAPVARASINDASQVPEGPPAPAAIASINDASRALEAPSAQTARPSVQDTSSASAAQQQPQQATLRAGPSSLKKRKRQTICRSGQPAEEIAAVEIRCREELHKLQKDNEEKKKENLIMEKSLLELKKEFLLTKIEFFRKKINI